MEDQELKRKANGRESWKLLQTNHYIEYEKNIERNIYIHKIQ